MIQTKKGMVAAYLAALVIVFFTPNTVVIAQSKTNQGTEESAGKNPASKATGEKEVADESRKQGYTVKLSTPIFGQVVMFSYPKEFSIINEQKNSIQYLQESVLPGESGEQWTQMITIIGFKGGAARDDIKPYDVTKIIASGFKNACPTSFGATNFGVDKVADHDAFAAVISCGAVTKAGKSAYSETALIVVVKGKNDYYSIQWAERGSPSQSAVKYDESKWRERFKTLSPIKLCPNVPRDSTPFVLCESGT